MPLVINNLKIADDDRLVIFVDASGAKDFGCKRKYYWSTLCGLRPKSLGHDIKMPYGTAIHKALEHHYINKMPGKAAQSALDYYVKFFDYIPEKDFRTPDHLLKVIAAYFKYYSPDGIIPNISSSGEAMVEQKFCFPYAQNDRIVICLCGTIDVNGEYYGQRALVDHKSTAWNFGRAKEYFNYYEMDIQTQLYVLIDNLLNNRGDIYLPIVINGIFIKACTKGALEKGEFDGVKFARSRVIEYSVEQMNEFKTWLNYKITELLNDVDGGFENYYERSFCRTPFGVCKFFNICSMPTSIQKDIINANYEQRIYNPLEFGSETPE